MSSLTREKRHVNAGRKRQPMIWLGPIQIRWPRVKCQCGGSVKLNLAGWLEPYQRLTDEVDMLIQRWGALSLSLRQMRKELAHTYIGPLGLRTLNERLHQLRTLIVAASPPCWPPEPIMPPAPVEHHPWNPNCYRFADPLMAYALPMRN